MKAHPWQRLCRRITVLPFGGIINRLPVNCTRLIGLLMIQEKAGLEPVEMLRTLMFMLQRFDSRLAHMGDGNPTKAELCLQAERTRVHLN
jgi:hypothetical protein